MANDKTNVEWFLDRIGRRIWRNEFCCTCAVCADVYQEGLLVRNEDHADYTYCTMLQSDDKGFPLQYFDTKEERDAFELAEFDHIVQR